MDLCARFAGAREWDGSTSSPGKLIVVKSRRRMHDESCSSPTLSPHTICVPMVAWLMASHARLRYLCARLAGARERDVLTSGPQEDLSFACALPAYDLRSMTTSASRHRYSPHLDARLRHLCARLADAYGPYDDICIPPSLFPCTSMHDSQVLRGGTSRRPTPTLKISPHVRVKARSALETLHMHGNRQQGVVLRLRSSRHESRAWNSRSGDLCADLTIPARLYVRHRSAHSARESRAPGSGTSRSPAPASSRYGRVETPLA
ncbi:hypothetical protein GGX14DRAFT_618749 [Mycena pura]|uniref:Uncharacterized protein n=1 Tax=Mycena pura TaxID=153505 RepID=A0AAD6VJ12_9AGAR|nr:hypothetical protein GGX14DRAFT_618749 [Mycena pura]